MMQRNEEALLEPWLKYHGDLFGYENLFVFDNGSHSPAVIETLRAYAGRGVAVDWRFATIAEYALKGEVIADCIRNLQARRQYDLVFPLDCDEFVVMQNGADATVNRARIMDYTETVLPGSTLLRVATQFFNVIGRPGEFGRGACMKTAIVLDGTFRSSDHGHHLCATIAGNAYKPCDFAFVHYHYKPLPMLRDHARAKLAPFVDVDDPVAIASFNGPGNHLCRYLTVTEDDFCQWHRHDHSFIFSEFNTKLSELGAVVPF